MIREVIGISITYKEENMQCYEMLLAEGKQRVEGVKMAGEAAAKERIDFNFKIPV